MTTAQVTKGTPCGEVQLRGAPEAIASALDTMSRADIGTDAIAALRAVAAIAARSPAAVDALGFQNVRAIRAILDRAQS